MKRLWPKRKDRAQETKNSIDVFETYPTAAIIIGDRKDWQKRPKAVSESVDNGLGRSIFELDSGYGTSETSQHGSQRTLA